MAARERAAARPCACKYRRFTGIPDLMRVGGAMCGAAMIDCWLASVIGGLRVSVTGTSYVHNGQIVKRAKLTERISVVKYEIPWLGLAPGRGARLWQLLDGVVGGEVR